MCKRSDAPDPSKQVSASPDPKRKGSDMPDPSKESSVSPEDRCEWSNRSAGLVGPPELTKMTDGMRTFEDSALTHGEAPAFPDMTYQDIKQH